MATLMSDEVFHEVAYRAKKRDHLLAGIDEFLDAVTVLPPCEWGKWLKCTRSFCSMLELFSFQTHLSELSHQPPSHLRKHVRNHLRNNPRRKK